MIRVTFELLPQGNEARAWVIGQAEIALVNVLPGDFGEYVVVLKKTPPFAGALKAAWKRGRLTYNDAFLAGCEAGEEEDVIVARIGGHHRTRRGVYDLLFSALRACGLEQRNPPQKSPAEAA